MKRLLFLLILLELASRSLSAQTLTEKFAAEPITQLAEDAIRFGDPQRGALAFYEPTMNCARCHESQSGRRLGPDLAEARDVKPDYLVRAVLQPSAEIRQGFETAVFQLVDGTQVQGVIVAQTDSNFVVDRIEQPDKPLVLEKADVEDWKQTKLSSMPDGLANQLADRQQFLDLISYLAEIAAGGPSRAAALKPMGALATIPLPEYESRVDHAGLIRGLDDAGFERGAETFRLRCESCHGNASSEGSMPTSLRFVSGKFKNGNDPFRMYQTLTHGFGMMNSQRWMVPQQKYEVIHYIRQEFLAQKNPDQLFKITDDYLASLPKGDTRGPKPVVDRPWTRMNYGPSLINTIEVSRDGSNIAQKGIAIRLDDGPGGVESGTHWMMYDHDTMRLAGAWTGQFIDYEGIHFNGVHGRHPKIAGPIQFMNPTGPGWGRPEDGSFVDNRLLGRDDKHYGPLDRKWAHYKGMFRYGRQTILQYTVGDTNVYETPSLTFVGSQPVYTRSLNLGPRKQDLILQIASVPQAKLRVNEVSHAAIVVPEQAQPVAVENSAAISLNGNAYGQIENGDAFDMTQQDFTICCRVRTGNDGTIFSQTMSQNEWVPDGKSLFIRDGRPTFDIGWVGAANSKKKIDDNQWHELAMTWQAADGRIVFYVDGKKSGPQSFLKPKQQRTGQVARIGFTNGNFPQDSILEGEISELQFYQRVLDNNEIADASHRAPDRLVASWKNQVDGMLPDQSDHGLDASVIVGGSGKTKEVPRGLVAIASANLTNPDWVYDDDCLRLTIPAGDAIDLVIAHCPIGGQPITAADQLEIQKTLKPVDLTRFTSGGPANWPETLTTQLIRGDDDGPFAVDVFPRPTENPWNAQLRLTGLDFLPDGNTMVVSAWDGSIWEVSGWKDRGPASSGPVELTWKRVAAGLFQPLGIKWIDGKIYVTCRDQLAVLHDLNGDGEMDWYQNLNNDHQVTEHFHEFAMGLQTDDAGNFYYAKSARHALPALVPHHGTLLKVSPDGETTEIIANGFRAANGVCINPDGSFVVTDQEGHWNPKNRINWVKPGGFYGNMFGYHDVTDESDSAMDQPLCWITNAFDRSPSELLWVTSKKWGPLNGSLLNFSYGYGKVYIVPYEEVDGQMQGGMCEFPIKQFPTGVMRGRFNPADGQLYCCGMFAWAGNQQQPGGLYRIRYTGPPVHLPVGLHATQDGVEIRFSGELEPAAACDPKNFAISVWDLKRTANYGSEHYNQRRLDVTSAELLSDNKTVMLTIPDLKPTWGMEINYAIKKSNGDRLQGKIHNTIHRMGQ